VKICDLGFSRQFEESVGTFCGTTYYMAPEIYEQKKYNQKVDIWALGVLMFMMLFGSHPFRGNFFGVFLGVNILGDI
jgi:serine/threonine protein kinase